MVLYIASGGIWWWYIASGGIWWWYIGTLEVLLFGKVFQ